jgi:hypothetical protein
MFTAVANHLMQRLDAHGQYGSRFLFDKWVSCIRPGHHRFDGTAVLSAVNALRASARSSGFDPRSAGLRALTAPPRRANGGAYVMAG